MKTHSEIVQDKLLSLGWTQTNENLIPPPGMGGFEADEILNRVRREAEGEAAVNTFRSEYKPHWHEQNPWKSKLLYVPLKELAACQWWIGRNFQADDGTNVVYSSDIALEHWSQYGDKLDAYVIDSRVVSAGIRFGPEPDQYLTPYFSLPLVWALRNRFKVNLNVTKPREPSPGGAA